jgi:hypothetical protein
MALSPLGRMRGGERVVAMASELFGGYKAFSAFHPEVESASRELALRLQ